MKKYYPQIILLISIFTIASCNGKGKSSEYGDEGLGLRKGTLFNESSAQSPNTQYSDNAPGSGKKFERSFPLAPPMIPHNIQGFVPIKTGQNSCVGCHMPANAKSVNATPIPKSHLSDLSSGKAIDLNGKLSNARFFCTQCHAPQANASPPVNNNF